MAIPGSGDEDWRMRVFGDLFMPVPRDEPGPGPKVPVDDTHAIDDLVDLDAHGGNGGKGGEGGDGTDGRRGSRGSDATPSSSAGNGGPGGDGGNSGQPGGGGHGGKGGKVRERGS